MLRHNQPRPFLKWAGGKSKLVSQYFPYFPRKITRYHEPFLGGGAVFFHLVATPAFNIAFLTDINFNLINTYLAIKEDVEAVIVLLERHQAEHNKEYYYSMRSQQPKSSVEQAARFIYLNKTCFNGLYRENTQGTFNVPMGKYKNPLICNRDLLRLTSQALKFAHIAVQPFEAILEAAINQKDLVYFDPPYYPVSTTSNFTAYSRDAFSKDDQIRLRDIFATLAQRGVKVMLSNSDCVFIRELYSGFNIHEIQATRAINSNTLKRGKISELLITSY